MLCDVLRRLFDRVPQSNQIDCSFLGRGACFDAIAANVDLIAEEDPSIERKPHSTAPDPKRAAKQAEQRLLPAVRLAGPLQKWAKQRA